MSDRVKIYTAIAYIIYSYNIWFGKSLVIVCIWLVNVGTVTAAVTPVENGTSHKQLKADLLSLKSPDESEDGFEKDENESSVSITVVGASGDLAKKKIFPALFALYYEDCLPKVGFGWKIFFFICVVWIELRLWFMAALHHLWLCTK